MYPFSKRIFAIATFVFEEGISTIFLFTLLAFLMRVKKSAIGSVFISLLTIDYQLAFLIPGILPESAISLNVTLESPNCLIYRSEEHTSELQSRPHLVCRLLLEKKKK